MRRLGLVGAAALAALLVGLMVASVSAVSGTVGIGSATAAPGDEATVDLTADVPSPGLGAWTIDITYDAGAVSVVGCTAGDVNSICNDAFASDTIRVTGASAMGAEGASVLSSITFACGSAEGESALTLSVEVFADATIGDPTDITETASNGSITCAVAVDTPTEEPEATATEEVTGLAEVGTGGPSDGSSLGWLIAALAGVGLAAILGFSALRVRARKA